MRKDTAILIFAYLSDFHYFSAAVVEPGKMDQNVDSGSDLRSDSRQREFAAHQNHRLESGEEVLR